MRVHVRVCVFAVGREMQKFDTTFIQNHLLTNFINTLFYYDHLPSDVFYQIMDSQSHSDKMV